MRVGDYRAAVVRRAVIDALAMRQELQRHDIEPEVKDRMMIAAVPALIEMERVLVMQYSEEEERDAADRTG